MNPPTIAGHGAIRVTDLTRHFATVDGPVRALDGVTFEIESGTAVAIVGPSGCGKSTLLGLIAGLAVPTAGGVTIGGTEISHLPDDDRARLRRRSLGLVFQSANLLPWLTAVENVALQLALAGVDGEDQRCVESLSRLGLGAQLDRLPDQLSGGERQRVAVARALIHGPRAILADEPTGALDALNATVVVDRLVAAQRETGATLVVVTHDPAIARRMDRTLHLTDGRLTDDVIAGGR